MSPLIIALAALAAVPALGQNYGGLDFESHICADNKLDGMYHCASTPKTQIGFGAYTGSDIYGAAIGKCTKRTCDPSPTDVGALFGEAIGFYHSYYGFEASATQLTHEAGSAEQSSSCSAAEGCRGSASYCFGTYSASTCYGLLSGNQVMASNTAGSDDRFEFYYNWGNDYVTSCIVEPGSAGDCGGGTAISWAPGEAVSYWWGALVNTDLTHVDFGYGAYDRMAYVMRPWFNDYSGSGPSEVYYLQGGTWKTPSQVDPDTTMTAAKCSFSGGNDYYVEFSGFVINGPLRAATQEPKLASGLSSEPAYVNCYACASSDPLWIFSFDPNVLGESEFFNMPLVRWCFGTESCTDTVSERSETDAISGGVSAAGAAPKIAVVAAFAASTAVLL